MRWVGVVGVLVVGFFAGCLGGDEGPGAAVAEGPLSCGEELNQNISAQCSVAGDLVVDAPLVEERTLDAPPVWRLGEWWTYRVTDRFTGTVSEGTRVVAGVEGDNYLVGQPADQFSSMLMVLHVPGFGQVSRADLSFEIHDCPYAPLQFPLTDGLEGEGAFECSDFNSVVTVDSPTEATITLSNPNGGGGLAGSGLLASSPTNQVLKYDAAVGEVVSYEIQGYALIEIIDHGFNFTGVVTVPHMHDVIFLEQRLGPVGGQPGPDAMTDRVTVDTTYDRVSFILLAGDVGPALEPSVPHPVTTGAYTIRGFAPDGETYELSTSPTDSKLRMEAYTHMFPGGEWRFEHTPGGPGITLAEGIAYHVYDVDLPSGVILPNIGEHEHGGNATVAG